MTCFVNQTFIFFSVVLTCLYVAFSIMGVTEHIYYFFNVNGNTGHVNQLVTFNLLANKTKFT